MMLEIETNYTNTDNVPMDIDTTDYIQWEPMDIDTINTNFGFQPMDIEISRKKRRYDEINKGDNGDDDEEEICYPPFKRDRPIRKAKKPLRRLIVAPALVYFVF